MLFSEITRRIAFAALMITLLALFEINAADDKASSKGSSGSSGSVSTQASTLSPKKDGTGKKDKASKTDDQKHHNTAKESGNEKSSTEGNETQATKSEADNDTESNGSDGKNIQQYIQTLKDTLSENKNAVQITMFVLIGLTSLVVLYFIVKTMRLKQKKSKSRKYGVLTNGMEMDHLESDSDDEDTTVFELNHRR
ncbi:uncharacterized protein LOC142340801 [Convolutriloba macropyga]|uniref:uncharacterized protein LOC142340801 n=1 Tax=Convolutriloba macropyga TaxID=536237 RepID=UPI003F5205BF